MQVALKPMMSICYDLVPLEILGEVLQHQKEQGSSLAGSGGSPSIELQPWSISAPCRALWGCHKQLWPELLQPFWEKRAANCSVYTVRRRFQKIYSHLPNGLWDPFTSSTLSRGWADVELECRVCNAQRKGFVVLNTERNVSHSRDS